MNIIQFLADNQGKTLTIYESYLMHNFWIYHNSTLSRNQRVLLETENISSVSCFQEGNSLLFTLDNDSKVVMSYENNEIILQFPQISLTKHHYTNFTWS